MPSFLSLFQNNYNRDPRPTRFAKLARSFGDVTVCALGGAEAASADGMAFVPLAARPKGMADKVVRAVSLVVGRYEGDIWNNSVKAAFAALHDKTFSCIFCHDLVLLPLACALRDRPQNLGRCKIILDAREFYPRQFEDRLAWRVFLRGLNHYLCLNYLGSADHIFTVSPGLAEGYAREYSVSCSLLPSYSPAGDYAPRPTEPQIIRCIHHGDASPSRTLERMIEAVHMAAPRFSLDLMLMPTNRKYYEKLKSLAGNTENVRLIPTVPMPEIVPFISQYDMGLFLLPPVTFNHRHFLPNKLFEFIQARLAVAVGPSPDMAQLVEKHKLGVISNDFTSQAFADMLNSLRPKDIDGFKANAHAAASELCWERNDEVIAQTVRQLLV